MDVVVTRDDSTISKKHSPVLFEILKSDKIINFGDCEFFDSK